MYEGTDITPPEITDETAPTDDFVELKQAMALGRVVTPQAVSIPRSEKEISEFQRAARLAWN